MLIDGRLVPHGGTLRAAVAVIGAGPAGISITEELAANGVNVLLLEAGGRHHAAADDDALQGVGAGVPFPQVASRRRGFGGTSGHWAPTTGLRIRPLDSLDLTARPGAGEQSWPIIGSELARYYERAHSTLGMVDGYSPSRWGLDDGATPLVWSGGPQLAMFQFAPHDVFTSRFETLAGNPHVDVTLHSCVREVRLADDGNTVSSLAVVCPGGNEFVVEATVFVLAAGGIDNARLLLASPGRTGRGLGNEHDNVGRYFMDHLSVDTGTIVPADGRTIDVSVFAEQRGGSDERQAMLWLGPEIIEREGLANAAFWVNDMDAGYLSPGVGAARSLRLAINSTPRTDIARHVLASGRGGLDLIAFGGRKLLRRPPRRRAVALRAMTEQLPNRDSRITLTDDRDALGLRRIKLDWRVTDDDLATVRRHQDVLAKLLEERGVGTVADRFVPDAHPSPVMSNYHHIGSTRMHVDPQAGVVDADSRVHGTANLLVAGSSVFPTGGYLNPTLTIVALAIRVADTVRRDLRTSRVSAA